MAIFKKNTDFKLTDIEKGHFNVTYKGIAAVKCPFDYVLYQMLIWDLKPDLIIEIGTYKGGSTLYLADLLDMNDKGVVHTIDIPANEADPSIQLHPRIKIFREGYENYDLSAITRYQKVMVIEDGSHQYQDSLQALNRFAKFISLGSYYIAEDGIVTELGKAGNFEGGPQKAVNEFLRTNDQFIIDRKYCDFFGPNATFNVNGYLKRVK